jgi:hypothetical protein
MPGSVLRALHRHRAIAQMRRSTEPYPGLARVSAPGRTHGVDAAPLWHNGKSFQGGWVKVSEIATDSATIELTAVIVAVTGDAPRVLAVAGGRALPSGPLEAGQRSLQTGLRSWVERQTHHPLGYIEQLYTFADRDRQRESAGRVISISYLGLTREAPAAGADGPAWQDWYRYFPWEDWRQGPPTLVARAILPRLRRWAAAGGDLATRRTRAERSRASFAADPGAWNEELVLQRYELLYEAGLVPEAGSPRAEAIPGEPMQYDHRRILATGIARLRAKIKYRPVVFELMPPAFTLLQLQRAVEALAGRPLHKQNFRRLIDQQGLVEETGAVTAETGGRPAKLFRFRRAVLRERALAGTKLPLSRPA